MSGPNEHHIPQFLQRAFAVKRKGGQPNEIWEYRRAQEPTSGLISKTASEDHFYGSELDGKLKVPENQLGQRFASLRKQPAGSVVDAVFAADLISHLAPRAKHLRVAMLAGFHQLALGAQRLFGSTENLSALLGLDEQGPNERFTTHLRNALEDHPQFMAVGLPVELLDRIAFQLAKEQFDVTADTMASSMASIFSNWPDEAPHHARDSHNKALERMSEGRNPRRDRLATFDWTIIDAPADGAVLPDCIALGFPANEAPLPMMFVDNDVACVVMPISTSSLLVGREPGVAMPDLTAFNAQAAACSEEFFLAHVDCQPFRALAASIGSRTAGHFEEMMQSVVMEALPARADVSFVAETPAFEAKSVSAGEHSFSYNIQCWDFGDEEINRRLVDAISPIVERLSRVLPMHRLDGITIAVDYWQALGALDRGHEGLAPVVAEGSGDVGIVGTAVLVVREGQAKGRVVLSILAADYLLSDDEAALGLGLQTLVHQLVMVAIFELLEHAVPGSLLSPVIEDPLQIALFAYSGDALTGFIAARVAGGFGDGETLARYYRNRLCEALDHLKEVRDAEREAFALHADIERIGAALFPAVGPIAYWAALLLGHCEATDEAIADQDGKLAAALEQFGLSYWLYDFGQDLLSLWNRLGRWSSLDEFLTFNRHIERLLWAVGAFPWMTPEGIYLRVF